MSDYAFLGILFFCCVIWILHYSIVARQRYSLRRKLTEGPTLATWKLTRFEWRKADQTLTKHQFRDAFQYWGILVIPLIICAIVVPEALREIILAFFGVTAIFVVLAILRLFIRNRKSNEPLEVRISKEGALVGNRLYPFSAFGYSKGAAKLVTSNRLGGKSTSIELFIRLVYLGRPPIRTFRVEIPVPANKLEEARSVVDSLNRDV